MIINESDRKRLAKIKAGVPYGATRADLNWLVTFAEKLLKQSSANDHGPKTNDAKKPKARS